ncbi:hypothetical protein TYRP_008767 [Tyrophagus putrescentiae]|nr:hypothetical protein TYRP_008767 [Tyrophagus putrescentiae]
MKTVISEMSSTSNINNVQPTTSSANTDSSKARGKTARSRSCSNVTPFFDDDGSKSRSAASVSPGEFSRAMSCTDIDSIRLPSYWRMTYTVEGKPYYFNSDRGTVTWIDPRKMEAIRKSHCNLRIKIQSVLRGSRLRGVINAVEIIGYVKPQLKNFYKIDIIIGRKDFPKILKPETLDENGRAFFETIYGRVYYSEETITQEEGVISWRAVTTGNVRRALSCTDLDTKADLLPKNWKVYFDGNYNAYYRNQLDYKEWTRETPRTATAQLRESFKTAMKRSESTGNLFGCTSWSQSALVIRIHSTTNDCSILGRSCYDDRTLKIYFDTGRPDTFISRSRTPPKTIFKVPNALRMEDHKKTYSTNEMVKLTLTHRHFPPVEVLAYVINKLPDVDILLGQKDIAKVLKPETLDSSNGRAYLDTIYGRVYYSSGLSFRNKNYNRYYFNLGKIQPIYTAVLRDICFGPDDIAQILKPEALDNGRAYLNTIYGRVYYSDKLFSKNYNLYYQQLHFGKPFEKTT